MAVGFPTKANWAAGDVLTASALDDLAGTVNLVSAPLYNAAGKNKIINGDFGIWQRGTTFSPANYAYTADRWYVDAAGAYATSITCSQQTFTPGSAPVAGYEGTYFYRLSYTKAASQTAQYLSQRIEDVRIFAGQTVTLSFWAKSDASRTVTVNINQNFGSGGSSTVVTSVGSAAATTSWTRFSLSVAIPSVTGKTIGTSSFLEVQLVMPNATSVNDFWGIQLEAGSYATGFQTATGSVQGELALCQRYYYRVYSVNQAYVYAFAYSATSVQYEYRLPVTMRTTPNTIDQSNIVIQDISVGTVLSSASAATLNSGTPDNVLVLQSGYTALVIYRPYNVIGNGTLGYIGFGAEL